MPTAGKLFLYRESLTLQQIHDALEGWEETWSEDPMLDLTLRRNVEDLDLYETSLSGIFSEDGLRRDTFRGVVQAMPYTTESVFTFFLVDDAPYCAILAKKGIANNVANRLSVILHDELGAITLPVLNIMKLKQLYATGEATKILLVDDLEIPNMNKATLYGDNVIQTDWYGRFVNVGTPWYVVFKDKSKGYTVGLVRDGTVCIFSTVDTLGFLDYMKSDIIPLVLRRGEQ